MSLDFASNTFATSASAMGVLHMQQDLSGEEDRYATKAEYSVGNLHEGHSLQSDRI